jgi:hypothetical protein
MGAALLLGASGIDLDGQFSRAQARAELVLKARTLGVKDPERFDSNVLQAEIDVLMRHSEVEFPVGARMRELAERLERHQPDKRRPLNEKKARRAKRKQRRQR